MKQKQLDQLANLALQQYEGSFPSIEFYAKETSTIYKITDSDQKEYALKIYEEEQSNSIDHKIELLILEAIQNNGSIKTTEVIPNKAGAYLTQIQNATFKNPRSMILTKWLEGLALKDHESESIFTSLGKLMAALHKILKEISLPKEMEPKRWDKVLYFRNEQPNYKEQKNIHGIDQGFINLMDQAIPTLDKELKRIYQQETPQLLHGDLNPWNIKLHQGKLALLDFEDTIYGPRIHELAIMLYYYKNDENFSFDFVKNTVLSAYQEVYPIQEFEFKDIEILMMARLVNFLNYVLILEGDYANFIKKGVAELSLFMESNY